MKHYKKLLYCLITGLVLAALLHIIIILALPYFSKNNAWYRISKEFKPYAFNIISNKKLPTGKPMISGLDPMFIVAACHFDLNDGPLEIEAKGNAPYWSFSLYDIKSTNHYTLNDQNTSAQHLSALILNEQQNSEVEQQQAALTNERINIKVPFNKGLAVIRILRPDQTWDVPIAAFIKNANCQPLEDK